MATDWAENVKKYDPGADDGIIAGVVRYCGIALQKRDSSLVSFGDPKETERVRKNFLQKKLGLTQDDSTLDAAIAAVGDRMKGESFKNRVTVYYLLAQHFDKLGLFQKAAGKGAAGKASADKGAAGGAGAGLAAGAGAGAAAMGLASLDTANANASSASGAAAPKARDDNTGSRAAAGIAGAGAVGAAGALGAASAAGSAGSASTAKTAGTTIGAGTENVAASLHGDGHTGHSAEDAGHRGGDDGNDLLSGAREVASDTADAASDLARNAAAGVAAAGAAVAGAAGAAAAGVADVFDGDDDHRRHDGAAGGTYGHADTGTDGEGGLGWLWWLLAALLLFGLIWWLFFRQPDADPAATSADTTSAAATAEPAATATTAAADGDAPAAGTAFAAAPAEGAAEIPSGAGVTSELRAGKPVVKVYFDTASTAVAPAFGDAATGLKDWLAANPGSSLAVSGYNDSTGNAAANAELSKNRAFAVRGALIASGIAEGSVETVKPEQTTAGAGSDAAARRVEVVVR